VKKRGTTDGSLLASLPWTLAALALAVAPHVQYLPMWISVALVACGALRWQIERKRWRLPPVWLRIVLPLAGFIGVFASFETISGVGPGSALLAVMAALKLLETRQRRDQFVLLFISIFLIMASLLREQHVWSLPFLVAGLALTMTAWLRLSAAPETRVRESFATGGRLLLYAAPLSLAMWIFFPRISTPFWSVPIDTSTAATGLSDTMSPGDISGLSQSNAVAFRATFDGAVPGAADRYWRGLVLHRFNGRTWSGSDPIADLRALSEIETLGDPVTYEITMEPTRQHWIFALDMPYQWSLDRTFMGPQQQLARAQPVDQRVAYDALSYLSYRTNASLTRAARSWYLRLPSESNARTIELATRMRRASRDDAAYIGAVLAMFREEEYYYTLQPPPLGRDPVDGFLFDTRRGFCEHYASAFAVMMRAAGIPARVVLGYQGGEMNPLGSYMIVRQSDAHAWTEVWLPNRGWVRTDPTAAVAPERIEVGMSAARFGDAGTRWGLTSPALWVYQLELAWDLLNASWNAWILGYGPENQARFMRWLGMEDPDWRKMMLTLVAVIAILIGLVSLLLLYRYRPPARDEAARLYRQFVRKAGMGPVRGETPPAYASRLASAGVAEPREAEAVARWYLAARYGPPQERSLRALRTAVRLFRRRKR
jgi:protein-glutamine gamma-glutamyltransferase